jgi:protein SCO1/2
MVRTLIFTVGVTLMLLTGTVRAQPGLPPVLREVRFEQKLDAQLPLELTFRDESGQTVRLEDLFKGKPAILNLAYLRCPMLCDQVMNGMVKAMLDMTLDLNKDFLVLTVSFDARETPEMARAKKSTYLQRYGRPGAEPGWLFLTGDEDAIKRLTGAVGFHYVYDPRTDQFAHASGIVVLTPGGKVSRYFYDVHYSPRDLRLALVEASANRIGSLTDQVLLFCFHYDPLEGKYGIAVMRLVRAGGILTLLGVVTLLVVLWRKSVAADFQSVAPADAGSAAPADRNSAATN